jgi:23S rRNA (adenine2503-C2)-methyltransferase
MEKAKLIGKSLSELKTIVSDISLPSFTAKQIADWLYKKRVRTVDEMTNISLKGRNALKEKYEVGLSEPVEIAESVDGTKKYLFKADNRYIESVYIPEKERATLCVSTQIGCKMNCAFCSTGKQGFSGNLSVTDILNQIQSVPESEELTNIVFMGMGEPFDNIDEVMKALDVITSDYGYGWSPKRITVSSVGLLPGLKIFLEKSRCNLAISMHSPYATNRLSLMPIEKAYPIAEILDELKKHDFTGQQRVSFEYILFKGINDQPAHVRGIIRLLSGLECRVNLIRYHTVPGMPFETTPLQEMEKIQDELNKNGIRTTIRKSRGEDILAACGLLSTQKKNKD